MTPKNKLFIGILTFMLIVNILVIFDLNQFYIRTILAFIFIITIPGLLIMLCLKIRNINFWEYLVYTIGLSVAFIMFAGLAVNWILPWLHVTDKPLSLWPILICFDIFLIIFWIIAYKRNSDLKFKIKFPKFSWLDRIFIIIPMFFPVLSILGAFLLNNHGPNILTMIMLGAIAVYVFMIVIFRDKLNENVFPWALWMIGLSLLFSGWLRSWYVSGMDINQEYLISQITKEHAFWTINNFRSTYNAMLSVSILPLIVSLFTKLNINYIFKLLIPLIFSFIPLAVYLISKKYLKLISCFLVSFLFISQPTFINWLSIPIRQGPAFLFFSLMLLVLFTKEINPALKKLLFVIFGFSMIVSHYSTSYIALAIFLFVYILTFFYKKWENRKIKKGKLKPEEKQQFYLSGILILLLLVFGFLWYSQVTPTADGLIDFTKKSFSNFGNMFSEEVRQESTSDPLFGLFRNPDINNIIKDYQNKSISDIDLPSGRLYNPDLYKNYKITYLPNKKITEKLSILENKNEIVIFYAKQIISKIIQFFMLVGIITFILSKDYNNDKDKKEFLFFCFITLLFLCLMLILPFFSIQYELSRFLQQILIVLSFSAILGGIVLFKFVRNETVRFLIVTFLIIIFYLLFSGFLPQTFGGSEASMQLNNFGKSYNEYYTHNAEINSGKWLYTNKENYFILADLSASKKLSLLENGNKLIIKRDIIPQTIDKKTYVYLDLTNKLYRMGHFSYAGMVLSFNFPTEFLNDNKNLIYNNGGSEIFK